MREQDESPTISSQIWPANPIGFKLDGEGFYVGQEVEMTAEALANGFHKRAYGGIPSETVELNPPVSRGVVEKLAFSPQPIDERSKLHGLLIQREGVPFRQWFNKEFWKPVEHSTNPRRP
jgi:hypothetical protein